MTSLSAIRTADATPVATETRHDVVIVGAGIAGTACAILLSRHGLDVLVIDRKASREDHKVTCTTFIQASALPVIRKLGVKPALDAAGAVKNKALFWTPYGWIRDPVPPSDEFAHGYSIQRRKLDPLMLAAAEARDGVTVRLGASLRDLVTDGSGCVVGVVHEDQAGGRHVARARLVIAADGRNSPAAALAEVPTKHRHNARFVNFAYYRDMPLKTGKTAQFWQKGRDMGFAYPFDDDLTMLCCFVRQEEHEAWAKDKFAALEAFFDDLPGAPDRSRAVRASKMLGMRTLRDFKRPAAHRGMALVGDACMSCDPMSGVGCGFALQAADWLAAEAGPALARGEDIAPALEAYRRRHARELGGHEYFIQDNSNGRAMNVLEKLVSRAAVADGHVAHQLHLFISRIITWRQFLSPYNLARILWSNVTYARAKDRLAAHEPV